MSEKKLISGGIKDLFVGDDYRKLVGEGNGISDRILEAFFRGVIAGAGIASGTPETYEQAVARTGRKWPYRTEEWPCPACSKASCDMDIKVEMTGRMGDRVFIYRHKETN